MKSVVIVAGKLKDDYPDEDEQTLAMKAMIIVN